MPVGLIRTDDRGPYMVLEQQRYRPGPLYLPRPSMRHDDGGLQKGDRPRFRRIPCAPAVIMTASDGGETVWETEDCKDAQIARDIAAARATPDPETISALFGRNVVDVATRIDASEQERTHS